ncbi:MAG: sugar ABC transporter permease [Clostridiales bacterium]|uniref:carbohydrate ABC transporter permease n=1 Tax=Zhenhengia sp. TaxID=2944208 RepID=UPI002910F7BE|nr:sugar ABC transporter permease [Clostridiales bacterium]
MIKQQVSKIRIKETLVSYAFLAPALIFFTVFVIYPMLSGVFTSLFDYTLKKFEFIGLENYINLFRDEIFWKSMGNTLIIVIGSVPIVLLFSIFVAVTIYQKRAGVRSFFRGVFYLPVVTGTVAVTVVWKWIYDPLNGILNYILESGGIIEEPIMWLGDKRFAIWAIIIILLTTSVGQPIILYVAALGNIPQSFIEAAEVDGGNKWQVFTKIKWPCLMPTTLYVVVITTINSFQCFSLIQLLTSGGPNYSTSTIMYLVYEKAFKLTQFGYANAMGVILAIIIGIISFIQFKVLGNDVEY